MSEINKLREENKKMLLYIQLSEVIKYKLFSHNKASIEKELLDMLAKYNIKSVTFYDDLCEKPRRRAELSEQDCKYLTCNIIDILIKYAIDNQSKVINNE